jgi:Rrf2 family protein
MAHITTRVEYGIHCLLWLSHSGQASASSRDLAELQGVSPSFVAKIFQQLEKAGIVAARDGVRGGYRLAKKPELITVLALVDALEGDKPLFDCQEIRDRCAVFDGAPPRWATDGVCAIHAVMLRAEKAMREELRAETLASISNAVARKAPQNFDDSIVRWLDDRAEKRVRTTSTKS